MASYSKMTTNNSHGSSSDNWRDPRPALPLASSRCEKLRKMDGPWRTLPQPKSAPSTPSDPQRSTPSSPPDPPVSSTLTSPASPPVTSVECPVSPKSVSGEPTDRPTPSAPSLARPRSHPSLRNSGGPRVPLTSAPAIGQFVWLPQTVHPDSVFHQHKANYFYGKPGKPENHPLVVIEAWDDIIVTAQCTSFSNTEDYLRKDKSAQWARMYHPVGHSTHRWGGQQRLELSQGDLKRLTYVNVSSPLVVEWKHCETVDGSIEQPRLDIESWRKAHNTLITSAPDPRRQYKAGGCMQWVKERCEERMQPLSEKGETYQLLYNDCRRCRKHRSPRFSWMPEDEDLKCICDFHDDTMWEKYWEERAQRGR
ncbi:hypothetical protein KVT40_000598 [Elsinoe batatas]|uniref:Uncharacterized protein n=1 Tax=Elsinoe batatas TaxID=2601811 RepID=A0A8K0LB95_9PEZI|nr:hypothetical protein KVT40_000598 [Elsinoe batatas]